MASPRPHRMEAALGRPLPLARSRFIGEVQAYRARKGYGGDLIAASDQSRPQAVREVSVDQRIAEARALLSDAQAPRPDDSFAAYTMLLHLFLAVEARYFGPVQQGASQRFAICEVPAFYSAAAGGVIGVLRDIAFRIDLQGNVQLERHSAQSSFRAAENDRFARLSRFAWGEPRPASDEAPPPKHARLEGYFTALQSAPAPEDRLQAFAVANWLLCAMENRYAALRSGPGVQRLFTSLPFSLYETALCPEAVVVSSAGHLLLYFADGTLEMYERDVRQDVREGRRLVAVTLRSLSFRIAGASASQSAAVA